MRKPAETMTMLPEAVPSRALLTLALLEIAGVGVASARRILRLIRGAGINAEDAVRQPALLAGFLPAAQLGTFEEALGKSTVLLRKLQTDGTRVRIWGDPEYPDRLRVLGDDAPLYVMLQGNERILSSRGVGFCGSRKASERALAASSELASSLAERRVNAVSGYAAGIDTAVHIASLASGGTTTIVLPLGILHFSIKRELKKIWDWDRVLVISQFPARLPWHARNAMLRNGTICALSDALVVVEAGESGGTIAAGKTGIELGLPVFALQYESDQIAPGNRLLISRGAQPLGRSRSSGRANVGRLLNAVNEHAREPLTLF